MNASARLVYCAPKYCHITPLLRELHWLPVLLRVGFKILLVTFKILHGVAPSYLKAGVHLKAVFWLGIMFLMQISRLRFKQSRISSMFGAVL